MVNLRVYGAGLDHLLVGIKDLSFSEAKPLALPAPTNYRLGLMI